MAGALIEITLDDAAARDTLAALAARGADLTPAMDEIGAALVSSTLLRFERGAGPDGRAWTQSARARSEGGQTLIDSGRLRARITHRAGADRVEVGTGVVYAAIHQFGGTIRPKAKKSLRFFIPGIGWRMVSRATLPARPFLGVSAEDREEITGILANYLSGAAP